MTGEHAEAVMGEFYRVAKQHLGGHKHEMMVILCVPDADGPLVMRGKWGISYNTPALLRALADQIEAGSTGAKEVDLEL